MPSLHHSSLSPSTVEMQVTSAIAPRQTMRGHTEWVYDVVHLRLPDVQRILTCSLDGSLRVWDLESGTQICDSWMDDDEEEEEWEEWMTVLTMASAPNSKTVACGSIDGTVGLWDVKTGKMVTRWREHTKGVQSVCWNPNGERVLSGSQDGTAMLRDVESGETIMGPIQTGHDEVHAVAYSPDGSKFATTGYGDGVKIWDSNTTGEPLHTLESFYSWYLIWTSDGKKLICSSLHHSIGIIDTTTWDQIAMLKGHDEVVTAITLSHNDRLLASTSWDGTARLWNLESNLQIGLPLRHEEKLHCGTLSADGTCLATGCNDTNVYVWDVGAILKEHHLEHLLPIFDAVSDADAKSFLNADATGVEEEDSCQPPPDFFDDSDYSAPTPQPTRSARHRLRALASSLASCPNAFFGRVHSLLHRPQPSTDELTDNIPPPQNTPSALISTTARATIRHLSNLWPISSGHSPSPSIVDVPFARAKNRIAAAGAPPSHDDCVPDEDFDSPPPSPNPNSQQAPATGDVPSPPPPSNLHSHPSVAAFRPSEEHEGSRMCFCF